MPIEIDKLALAIMSGPMGGLRLDLDRPILVGRDHRARVKINDARISRHHALIETVGNSLLVRDLGSKNGTYVNGSRIHEFHHLHEGDQLRIGRTLFAIVSKILADPPSSKELARGPNETTPDPPTADAAYSTPELNISRNILRRATAITNQIRTLVRGRHALYSLASLLRREFECVGAGICHPKEPFELAHREGEIEIIRQTCENLTILHPWSGPALIADEDEGVQTLLVFPVRARSKAEHLILLRRPLSAPFEHNHLLLAETLLECFRVLPMEDLVLQGTAGPLPDHLGLIGSSEAMQGVRENIRRYAQTSATVLVLGESGTGKELAARAIADLSPRRFQPYVELNCACMTPELVEAELFGAEKGAYTGSVEQRIGKIEQADGGTLFLDEVGELPLSLQAKLLRVLEGQPFYRLGGSERIQSDVRFICATNRDLEAMVEAGRFRADLYHRINILQATIPPLREHVIDIPELIPFLLRSIQHDFTEIRDFEVSPKALRLMLAWTWPGNVRELRNLLERCILLSSSTLIDENLLPRTMMIEDTSTESIPRLGMILELTEREEISRALMECDGKKSHAAKLLGISRPTLDKKIKQYAMEGLVGQARVAD